MWVSTVRVNTADECPQTSCSSSRRLATAASSIQQRDQQIEFHGCESHGDTVAMHATRGGIDFDRTEDLARNVGGRTAASGPSQQRADTRHQLEQAKWFGDVVVCAEPESSHLVGLLTMSGQDQHRHIEPVVTQRLQYAVAVETWQHQIEDDEVGP